MAVQTAQLTVVLCVKMSRHSVSKCISVGMELLLKILESVRHVTTPTLLTVMGVPVTA